MSKGTDVQGTVVQGSFYQCKLAKKFHPFSIDYYNELDKSLLGLMSPRQRSPWTTVPWTNYQHNFVFSAKGQNLSHFLISVLVRHNTHWTAKKFIKHPDKLKFHIRAQCMKLVKIIILI